MNIWDQIALIVHMEMVPVFRARRTVPSTLLASSHGERITSLVESAIRTKELARR